MRTRKDGMRRRKTWLASSLTVAAAVALVAALPAPAHVVRFESRVKIEQYAENAVFLGHVRSERKACKRHRWVVVWRKRSGPDERIGKDRSGRQGLWGVGSPNASGTFYAVAKRKVMGTGTHRHVCKRDRSPNFVP